MLPTLTVTLSRIKVDSTQAQVWETGGGEAVIAVHGLLSDGRAMIERLGYLGGRFRVIAADLPGFGGSDKPRGFLYSPDGYAAFLVRLARVMKLARFAVVGGGAGKIIAARVARKDPERVVCAAAIEEPRSITAAAKMALHSRAARKLVETIVRGQGGWREFVRTYGRGSDLADALASAFAQHTGAARDEIVDERAEQARAEELGHKEKQRRRLRVIP
jgi:pimeloyl-ACP methyl ester carboxylesterase